MADYDKIYEEYRFAVESAINGFCESLDCKPKILGESMAYSLLSGGKRLRAVIMLASADILKISRERVINFALAIELIHTYSLIHDDLPEMDNDDFRRGKLSNHKVFGAGNAVLAGDALLNTAYSILINECRQGENAISAAEYICNCAGIYGMIAGQSADLLHENDISCNEETVEFINENKTGKMLIAACVVPSILSGGKYFPELKAFGDRFGALFQLTDDILDVEGSFENLGKSIGKDAAEGKSTSIKLYGLEKCKIKAELLCSECLSILEGIDADTRFFEELTNRTLTRNK